MLPAGRLVSSGYDRLLTDTQTYTAIPVPKLSAYGIEVGHRGSLFVVQWAFESGKDPFNDHRARHAARSQGVTR